MFDGQRPIQITIGHISFVDRGQIQRIFVIGLIVALVYCKAGIFGNCGTNGIGIRTGSAAQSMFISAFYGNGICTGSGINRCSSAADGNLIRAAAASNRFNIAAGIYCYRLCRLACIYFGYRRKIRTGIHRSGKCRA